MSIAELICGVDEAGRGPLAGPVCAAAVILCPLTPIDGLDDSKKLSEARREELAALIKTRSLCWAVAWASVAEIDALNIRQANLLAMARAVNALAMAPALALIDGNDPPELACETRAIIGGDGLEACISAASILAKTARDRAMVDIDRAFPDYGFAAHKGYGVPRHLNALREHGPCPHHRVSFKPVREAMRA